MEPTKNEQYSECPSSAVELLADIDILRVLKLPNEAIKRIDLYVQSHVANLAAENKELKEAFGLHPKVLNFAREMQKQISINTELGKTTWEEWGNIKEILVDFEYHKAKAIMALKEDNIRALQEYLADCGNILMFLGNACGMYTSFEDSKPVFQMVSPLFTETTLDKAVLKKSINNL